MKTADAVKFFGTKRKIADLLGLTQGAISLWGDVVPLDRAVILVKHSFGNLHIDLACYDQGGKVKKEAAA